MANNQTIRTGKRDAKGYELALTHYSKGVWKVLGLKRDGTTAWFIPTTSKANALARIEWLATEAPKAADVPDEQNPTMMFSTTNTALLVAAVRGEININQLVKDELANRGLNWSGKWIGFEDAKALAKCFPRKINGKLTAISVPDND